MDLLLISAAEIARCYGTNCTKFGLDTHFKRDIRPNVRGIQEALARGDDPKDLTMIENVRDGKIGKGQTTHPTLRTLHVFLTSTLLSFLSLEQILMIVAEIVKFYGCHLTKKALQNYFNRDVNPNIKLLKDAVTQGTEPRDVVLIEGVRSDGAAKG